MILLTMHWDRFVLETWRFIDFERTFTYAYDAENFFTYPLFLFQVGVLISGKDVLHATMTKFTYIPLIAVIVFGYLLSYDLIYRLRLIISVGLMSASATLAVKTCLSMGEKHYEERYEERKKRKIEKLQRKRQIGGGLNSKKVSTAEKDKELRDKVEFLMHK